MGAALAPLDGVAGAWVHHLRSGQAPGAGPHDPAGRRGAPAPAQACPPGPGVDLKAGQALPFLYWTSGAVGLPGGWGLAEGPAGHPTVSLGHGLLSLGTLQLLL